MTQPSELKDLITGILICTVIIAARYAVPLTGILELVSIPLPILLYRLKAGRIYGCMIMLISLLVMTGFFNDKPGIVFYFGTLYLTGFTLGELIEKHLPVKWIITGTFLSAGVILFAALYIYTANQDTTVVDYIFNGIKQQHDELTVLFGQLMQVNPDIEINQQLIDKSKTLFFAVFPVMILSSYLFVMWLNLLFIRILLKKNEITVQSLEYLDRWRAPFPIFIGLLIGLILPFLVPGAPEMIILNCLIIILFIYFFQGIAVVSFYFEKKEVSIGGRSIFFIMMMNLPFIPIVATICGLLDSWFDFRKLNVEQHIK